MHEFSSDPNDHIDLGPGHYPSWRFLRQEREYASQNNYKVYDVFYCIFCLGLQRVEGKEPDLEVQKLNG